MSEENKTNPYTGMSKLSESEVSSMLSNVKEGDMQVLARLIVEMKNQNEEAQKRAKIQGYISMAACAVAIIVLLVILFWGMKFVPQVEAAVANANNLILSVNDEVANVSKVVDDEVANVSKAIDDAVVMINQTNDMVGQATGIMDNAVKMVDQAMGIVEETGTIVGQANTMMGEVQNVVTNLDKSSQELAATDIDGMLDNVNSLVATSEKSVQETVDKIDDIDLESLNKAIEDLATIISPLAKLFHN